MSDLGFANTSPSSLGSSTFRPADEGTITVGSVDVVMREKSSQEWALPIRGLSQSDTVTASVVGNGKDSDGNGVQSVSMSVDRMTNKLKIDIGEITFGDTPLERIFISGSLQVTRTDGTNAINYIYVEVIPDKHPEPFISHEYNADNTGATVRVSWSRIVTNFDDNDITVTDDNGDELGEVTQESMTRHYTHTVVFPNNKKGQITYTIRANAATATRAASGTLATGQLIELVKTGPRNDITYSIGYDTTESGGAAKPEFVPRPITLEFVEQHAFGANDDVDLTDFLNIIGEDPTDAVEYNFGFDGSDTGRSSFGNAKIDITGDTTLDFSGTAPAAGTYDIVLSINEKPERTTAGNLYSNKGVRGKSTDLKIIVSESQDPEVNLGPIFVRIPEHSIHEWDLPIVGDDISTNDAITIRHRNVNTNSLASVTITPNKSTNKIHIDTSTTKQPSTISEPIIFSGLLEVVKDAGAGETILASSLISIEVIPGDFPDVAITNNNVLGTGNRIVGANVISTWTHSVTGFADGDTTTLPSEVTEGAFTGSGSSYTEVINFPDNRRGQATYTIAANAAIYTRTAVGDPNSASDRAAGILKTLTKRGPRNAITHSIPYDRIDVTVPEFVIRPVSLEFVSGQDFSSSDNVNLVSYLDLLDQDDDDLVEYTFGLGSGEDDFDDGQSNRISINQNTNMIEFSGTAPDEGNYNIKLSVSEKAARTSPSNPYTQKNVESKSTTLNIKVSPSEEPEVAPIVLGPVNVQVNEASVSDSELPVPDGTDLMGKTITFEEVKTNTRVTWTPTITPANRIQIVAGAITWGDHEIVQSIFVGARIVIKEGDVILGSNVVSVEILPAQFPVPTISHVNNNDGTATVTTAWSLPVTRFTGAVENAGAMPDLTANTASTSSFTQTLTFPENSIGQITVTISEDAARWTRTGVTTSGSGLRALTKDGPRNDITHSIPYNTLLVDPPEFVIRPVSLEFVSGQDFSSSDNVNLVSYLDLLDQDDDDLVEYTFGLGSGEDDFDDGQSNRISINQNTNMIEFSGTAPDEGNYNIKLSVSEKAARTSPSNPYTQKNVESKSTTLNIKVSPSEVVPAPIFDQIPAIRIDAGNTRNISLNGYVSGQVNDDGISLSGNPSWIDLSEYDAGNDMTHGANRAIQIAPPPNLHDLENHGGEEHNNFKLFKFNATATGSGGMDTIEVFVYVDEEEEEIAEQLEVIAWDVPNTASWDIELAPDKNTINAYVICSHPVESDGDALASTDFATSDTHVVVKSATVDSDSKTRINLVLTVGNSESGTFTIRAKRGAIESEQEGVLAGPSFNNHSPPIRYQKKEIFWSIIDTQYITSGDSVSIPLEKYVNNATDIVFKSGTTPPSWITLAGSGATKTLVIKAQRAADRLAHERDTHDITLTASRTGVTSKDNPVTIVVLEDPPDLKPIYVDVPENTTIDLNLSNYIMPKDYTITGDKINVVNEAPNGNVGYSVVDGSGTAATSSTALAVSKLRISTPANVEKYIPFTAQLDVEYRTGTKENTQIYVGVSDDPTVPDVYPISITMNSDTIEDLPMSRFVDGTNLTSITIADTTELKFGSTDTSGTLSGNAWVNTNNGEEQGTIYIKVPSVTIQDTYTTFMTVNYGTGSEAGKIRVPVSVTVIPPREVFEGEKPHIEVARWDTPSDLQTTTDINAHVFFSHPVTDMGVTKSDFAIYKADNFDMIHSGVIVSKAVVDTDVNTRVNLTLTVDATETEDEFIIRVNQASITALSDTIDDGPEYHTYSPSIKYGPAQIDHTAYIDVPEGVQSAGTFPIVIVLDNAVAENLTIDDIILDGVPLSGSFNHFLPDPDDPDDPNDMPTGELKRDEYFTENESELAKYDGDSSLFVLTDDQFQFRQENAWVDIPLLGETLVTKFADDTERDEYFTENESELAKYDDDDDNDNIFILVNNQFQRRSSMSWVNGPTQPTGIMISNQSVIVGPDNKQLKDPSDTDPVDINYGIRHLFKIAVPHHSILPIEGTLNIYLRPDFDTN